MSPSKTTVSDYWPHAFNPAHPPLETCQIGGEGIDEGRWPRGSPARPAVPGDAAAVRGELRHPDEIVGVRRVNHPVAAYVYPHVVDVRVEEDQVAGAKLRTTDPLRLRHLI